MLGTEEQVMQGWILKGEEVDTSVKAPGGPIVSIHRVAKGTQSHAKKRDFIKRKPRDFMNRKQNLMNRKQHHS